MRLIKIDPAKNMARYYDLDIQQNLFGGVSLIRSWGRIGTKGQMKIDLHKDQMIAECSCRKLQTSKLNRGYKIAI